MVSIDVLLLGHYGSKHSFSPKADGQKDDTLVLLPLLESNCLSLMFHYVLLDSVTKFNCSKWLHQQALSTLIRPWSFVSGQGVCLFCPNSQNPDSSQTGPSWFIKQIMPLNGCSGPNAVVDWRAAECLHCQGLSVTRLLRSSLQPLDISSLSVPFGGTDKGTDTRQKCSLTLHNEDTAYKMHDKQCCFVLSTCPMTAPVLLFWSLPQTICKDGWHKSCSKINPKQQDSPLSVGDKKDLFHLPRS